MSCSAASVSSHCHSPNRSHCFQRASRTSRQLLQIRDDILPESDAFDYLASWSRSVAPLLSMLVRRVQPGKRGPPSSAASWTKSIVSQHLERWVSILQDHASSQLISAPHPSRLLTARVADLRSRGQRLACSEHRQCPTSMASCTMNLRLRLLPAAAMASALLVYATLVCFRTSTEIPPTRPISSPIVVPARGTQAALCATSVQAWRPPQTLERTSSATTLACRTQVVMVCRARPPAHSSSTATRQQSWATMLEQSTHSRHQHAPSWALCPTMRYSLALCSPPHFERSRLAQTRQVQPSQRLHSSVRNASRASIQAAETEARSGSPSEATQKRVPRSTCQDQPSTDVIMIIRISSIK